MSMKISMRHFASALCALCLLLVAAGAQAQTSTTGTIEGMVADTNGAPVPNVTVTVSSPNLIRPQSAQTDDEGRYQILNLPPGRYTVAVAATSGFGEFKQENVEVNLSKSSKADVLLQPAGATAVVDVTDTSGAVVDVSQNTSGTNISTEQFSNFPTQRTVQSLYSIAPTATRSGLRDAAGRDRDPSVAGVESACVDFGWRLTFGIPSEAVRSQRILPVRLSIARSFQVCRASSFTGSTSP